MRFSKGRQITISEVRTTCAMRVTSDQGSLWFDYFCRIGVRLPCLEPKEYPIGHIEIIRSSILHEKDR